MADVDLPCTLYRADTKALRSASTTSERVWLLAVMVGGRRWCWWLQWWLMVVVVAEGGDSRYDPACQVCQAHLTTPPNWPHPLYYPQLADTSCSEVLQPAPTALTGLPLDPTNNTTFYPHFIQVWNGYRSL